MEPCDNSWHSKGTVVTSAVVAEVDLVEVFVDSQTDVMCDSCLSMGLFRMDERFVSSRSKIAVTNIIDQRDRIS